MLNKQFCKHGHDLTMIGIYKDKRCMQCRRNQSNKSYSNNKEQRKKYYLAVKNTIKRKNANRNAGWKKYGILNLNGSYFTVVDFDKLYKLQDGKCRICQRDDIEFKKRLAVDHNRSTGIVRGLLCDSCNQGLGYFKENLMLLFKAIDYLKEKK